jgi:hypothetical protein
LVTAGSSGHTLALRMTAAVGFIDQGRRLTAHKASRWLASFCRSAKARS